MRTATDLRLAIAYGLAVLLHLIVAIALRGIPSERVDVENVASAPVTIRIADVPDTVQTPANRSAPASPATTPPAPRPAEQPSASPSSQPSRVSSVPDPIVADTPQTEPTQKPDLRPASTPHPLSDSEVDTPTPSSDLAESTMDDVLEKYIAEVRRRVLARKRYPALARRRAIEGTVIANFTIGSNGEIEAASTQPGAPRLLLRPTLDAVRNASPFPKPPIGPIHLEIPLTYSLKG